MGKKFNFVYNKWLHVSALVPKPSSSPSSQETTQRQPNG